MTSFTLTEKEISSTQNILKEYYSGYTSNEGPKQPMKPKTALSLLSQHNLSPPLKAHSYFPSLPAPEGHTHSPTSDLSPDSPGYPNHTNVLNSLNSDTSLRTDSLEDPYPITQPTVLIDRVDIQQTSPHAHMTEEFTQTSLDPPAQKEMSQIIPTQRPTHPISPPLAPTLKNKEKAKATRRSKRLQDKQHPNCSASKPPINPKSRMAKIPFDLRSHDIPLKESIAIQILHASGLQINQKVQNMIQEAVRLDQSTDATHEARPSTPLHDIVPPLFVPKNSLLLWDKSS